MSDLEQSATKRITFTSYALSLQDTNLYKSRRPLRQTDLIILEILIL